MNKKLKILLLFEVLLFVLLFDITDVYAAGCDVKTAEQMAKIVSNEVGVDNAKNEDENFFQKITTAAVVLNNAYKHDGNTIYEKLMNLTDNNYYGYSDYKNSSFDSIVPDEQKGKLLYIAEAVLTGKYTLPKNMTLQASPDIVKRNGTVWTYVENTLYNTGLGDVYFGYEGELQKVDVFGNKLSDTSVSYYKKLAKSLQKTSYNVTSSNVCNGNISTSNSGSSSNSNDNKKNDNLNLNACENPDILRVIYFGKLIIDIVKIVVPIGLIILGMVDFSKSVTTSDEGAQKKNMKLLGKRIVFAVLVFAVPWIVETLMVSLGNLTEGVNFTDCLENANSDCIDKLESGYQHCYSKEQYSCYYCASSNKYLWKPGTPSENCPGGIGWSKKTNIEEKNCK